VVRGQVACPHVGSHLQSGFGGLVVVRGEFARLDPGPDFESGGCRLSFDLVFHFSAFRLIFIVSYFAFTRFFSIGGEMSQRKAKKKVRPQ